MSTNARILQSVSYALALGLLPAGAAIASEPASPTISPRLIVEPSEDSRGLFRWPAISPSSANQIDTVGTLLAARNPGTWPSQLPKAQSVYGFTPGLLRFVVVTEDQAGWLKTVSVLDSAGGVLTPVATFTPKQTDNPIISAAITPNGQQVLFTYGDSLAERDVSFVPTILEVRSLSEGGRSGVVRGHEAYIEDFAFSPDSRYVYTATARTFTYRGVTQDSPDAAVRKYDLASLELLARWDSPLGPVPSIIRLESRNEIVAYSGYTLFFLDGDTLYERAHVDLPEKASSLLLDEKNDRIIVWEPIPAEQRLVPRIVTVTPGEPPALLDQSGVLLE